MKFRKSRRKCLKTKIQRQPDFSEMKTKVNFILNLVDLEMGSNQTAKKGYKAEKMDEDEFKINN
jgi:hypothetical protein